jgi:hypothetical protein
MAMNKDVLGAALKDRMLSMVPLGVVVPSATQSQMAEFWTAVADEVIKHIKENAQVQVTVNVTGTAVGGVCTGTGSGTGVIDGTP